jgi:hypothetical protein
MTRYLELIAESASSVMVEKTNYLVVVLMIDWKVVMV